MSVLVSFLVTVTECLTQTDILEGNRTQEERLLLLTVSEVLVHHVREGMEEQFTPWWPGRGERRGEGGREEVDDCCVPMGLPLFSPYSIWAPAYWVGPPTFGEGVSPFVNSL
jgi:hypothetical protein